MVGWGPEAYNRVVRVYENPIVRLLELGLVAAVLYHSFNGIKILLIDFFPSLAKHIRVLGITTIVVFVASMLPVTWIMGGQIIDLLEDLDGDHDRTSPRRAAPRAHAGSATSAAAAIARSAGSSCGRGSSCGSRDWCCWCSPWATS